MSFILIELWLITSVLIDRDYFVMYEGGVFFSLSDLHMYALLTTKLQRAITSISLNDIFKVDIIVAHFSRNVK